MYSFYISVPLQLKILCASEATSFSKLILTFSQDLAALISPGRNE